MTLPTPRATARMFPDLVTIQRRSVTQDGEGGEVETWSDYKTGIKAQFSSGSSLAQSETRTAAGTFVVGPARAYLLGQHPDITDSDRMTLDGHVYDIRGIELDSFSPMTGLLLEERSV